MKYEFKIHFKRKSFKRVITVDRNGACVHADPAYWLDGTELYWEIENNFDWLRGNGAAWIECPEHPEADEKYNSIGYWSVSGVNELVFLKYRNQLLEAVEKLLWMEDGK